MRVDMASRGCINRRAKETLHLKFAKKKIAAYLVNKIDKLNLPRSLTQESGQDKLVQLAEAAHVCELRDTRFFCQLTRS